MTKLPKNSIDYPNIYIIAKFSMNLGVIIAKFNMNLGNRLILMESIIEA